MSTTRRKFLTFAASLPAAMMVPNLVTRSFAAESTAKGSSTMPNTSDEVAVVAKRLTTPVRAPILHFPDEYGLEYEDVTFKAEDGVRLEAWWIPKKGSNKLIIANHPMNMNRYGIPSNLAPWATPGGNDIEVNYVPDYKNLHDAGYNVLVYDSRNFGLSAFADHKIFTWGLLESRDVVGSLEYAKSHPELSKMVTGLYSRCMGGNSTYIAMSRRPELFKGIRALVNPQPTSLRPFVENSLKAINASDQLALAEQDIKRISGFTVDQLSPVEYAKNCHVPTFIIQVHDDVLSSAADVQAIYDNIPVKDKKLFWIEGSTRRWDGYNYFPKHPEQLIDWFDRHMA